MLVVAWWLSGPAAADGYARQQDDVGTSGADLVLPLALLAAVVAVAAYTFLTRRRRAATRTTPHGGVPVPELAELDGRARAALVAADDAVRTGREDLAAATALAGAGAAQPFAQAVRHAEGELAAAFRLRQELDDARPEDEPARREMLEEVVARSVDAQRRLEEASDVLDALRSAPGSAKEALDAADERCRELAGRLGTAEAALAALRGRYAPSAAAPVATAPDQAGARLRTARERLAQARAAAGQEAAGELWAAEAALAQVALLVDAVDRRAVELAEAAGRLPGALAEAEANLAEAAKVLEDLSGGLPGATAEGVTKADLRGRAARAEAVTGDVRRSVEEGRYDPVEALRRVAEADASLGAALAAVRGRGEEARRARAFLEHALLSARSAVGAADVYVAVHRPLVRAPARTRLAEALRRLDEASGGAEDALPSVQEADGLARSAQALAEQDVRLHGTSAAG